MLKLFNPFKPHVVKFGEFKYGLRKLSKTLLFGWIYFDQQGGTHWWFSSEFIPKYCVTDRADKVKFPLGSGEYID